jgi:hypothetical protein
MKPVFPLTKVSWYSKSFAFAVRGIYTLYLNVRRYGSEVKVSPVIELFAVFSAGFPLGEEAFRRVADGI